MYAASTFMMQELTRRYFDDFLDLQEAGNTVEVPQIYTIPKSTPIPSHIILTNDFLARFTLQPSHGMALQDLNRVLDEFFDKHAVKEDAESWIERHPYPSSTPDDADDVWMKK
ncbi:hypothetical protein SPI_03801 [Niveomyces insectorum RCEF 264]|uniref:Tse2 ADP-ribosyltransferase toxin domain-containing protein n=1 Tax=Niveomyces insectorum RCEF 264 TaxID=1081102 RepID=A0A167WD80_9HYPO|nr:hypothetical protein SPI_03801 [Niveomyces insectorum RCEF 264]